MNKKTTCVFIAMRPGETVTIPYKVDEPVAYLLDRVCYRLHDQGIKPSSASLFINGIEINDCKSTVDYYRVFGTFFTLLAEDEGQKRIQIYIKTVDNKTVKREVSPECSIRHLKALLPKENWKHRLVLGGKTLESGCKVKDIGIDGWSSLSVIPRLVGGDGCYTPTDSVPVRIASTTPFADVSLASLRRVPLTSGPEFWLYVGTGINITATCTCMESSEVVCIHGLSTYKLGVTQITCPACSSKNVKPVTVGFYRCWFRTHGLKADGTQHSSDWLRIGEEDGYQEFDPAKQTEWVSLAVEARALRDSVDEDCTICLDPLFDDVDKLACGHSYHEDCISNWKLDCPRCRVSSL